MDEREQRRRLIANTIAVAIVFISAMIALYFIYARYKEGKVVPQTPETAKETPKEETKPSQDQKPMPQNLESEQNKESSTKKSAVPRGTEVPMTGPGIPEPYPY